MTKIRWLVLAGLVGALALVQHLGLERAPETAEEAPAKRLAKLPPGDILPTYVASLFFGSFRAVAIDVLWIQLKKVEEEKRWYERREILKMIKYFQPRNPEVWSHLGWHSAYNVANGFTDEERRWEWVRFGLMWLREGNDNLPDSPYLKWELAYTLFHKPSWQDGSLDLGLMRRIEDDAELQVRLLPPGDHEKRVRSSFELAILWLERAREDLNRAEEKKHLTQMGLYLYASSMDGFIRRCLMLQGMTMWKRGRGEEAKAWFRKAEAQCRLMTTTQYREVVSPLFKEWERFYSHYPEIIDLSQRARSGKPEDERAYLAKLQAVMAEFGPLDEMFFWSRLDRDAPLNRLKMRLSLGQDEQECNDGFELASPLRPGDARAANLEPRGLDVDFYTLAVQPRKEDGAPSTPPGPLTLRIAFNRPPSAGMDLKVTLLDSARRPVSEQLVKGKGEIRTAASQYGYFTLKVEPAVQDPWPADTRYSLQFFLDE